LQGVNGHRWLSSSLLLAAVLVLVLTWRLSSGVACAAAASSGRATFYELDQLGNCSFHDVRASDLYVALGPAEYREAAACGGFLDVSGPKGTVRVKVVDQCPECGRGHLDLSRAAFGRIADVSKGSVAVRYATVADPPVGPLSFRVKEGSSKFWFALLVDNHGNALRSVQVRSGGGAWRTLELADFGYWISETGAGTGPFQVRVTDVRGHTAQVSGIAFRPGVVQKTTTRLYQAAAAAPGAALPGVAGSAAPSATPTAMADAVAEVAPSTAPTPSATTRSINGDLQSQGLPSRC
jgi:expansin (peptidoglycan-binding protein)